jgi:CubicO group peptidase (beta-lactamase class C family)
MTRSNLLTALLIAAAPAPFFASPALAQPGPAMPIDFKATADAILNSAYGTDGPGATAIIRRDGKTIWNGSRGYADVEAKKPIRTDTIFELGSIAKQFTAAVILQLVDEGRLSLDDPLSKFFPDWPQPGAKATIRQLLNHTSGIKDFSKIPGWIRKNGERDIATKELLDLTKSLGSFAPPGTKWEYSNGGYVILGGIVEKVTGKSWYDAVDDRIAKPLGLSTLGYAVTAARKGLLAGRYSMADGKIERVDKVNMSIAGAAGGPVSDVADLATFTEALNAGKVVKPALFKEMTAPAKLADGSTEPYGFALHLRTLMGHPAYEHGGAGRGIDTDSIYLPDDKVFVAVFSNSDDLPSDSSDVLRRLAALAIGSPVPVFKPIHIDPKTVEPAFGVYKGAEASDIRFFARDGKYYLARGDYEMELLSSASGTFYSANDGLSWVRLVRDSKGTPELDLYGTRDAEPQRFLRTGAIPADAVIKVPPELLKSYVGDYQTETLTVSINLAPDGSLELVPKGQDAMPLRAVSNTEFMLDGNRMRIVFEPKGGKVDSFTMHRGARELHGKRVK